MLKDLPPLNSLYAFEASARLNSFKLAAHELHQTPAAIAYQIKKLEESLNTQLFTRHHKGVELNPAGQSYYSSIQTVLKQLQTETQKLKRLKARSDLKILTLHAIAEKWLMPRLKEFRQSHPEINIEISATDIVSTSRSHDIVIGFSHHKPNQSHQRILMEEQLFPVCSADYLSNHQIHFDNLTECDLMIDAHWHKDWEYWLDANNLEVLPKQHHSLSFSLYSMVIEAAVKGMGIMIGHRQLILSELKSNTLVKVFKHYKSVRGYYTLTTNHSKTNNQQIEFFTNWLYQQTK